jgi:hypothetical protein
MADANRLAAALQYIDEQQPTDPLARMKADPIGALRSAWERKVDPIINNARRTFATGGALGDILRAYGEAGAPSNAAILKGMGMPYKEPEQANAPPTLAPDTSYGNMGDTTAQVFGGMIGDPLNAIPLAGPTARSAVAVGKAAAPAGSLGMNVTSKRAFTAPQDEALRLAQQRAALPVEQHGLGLPADNTPQQRAAAMAFENGFWHETSAKNAENLRSFSLAPSMAKAAASDELTPYAVFLKRHGKTINVAENPVQMPMAVNVGREFGFVDRPSLQNSLVSNGPNAKEIQTAIENTKFYDKKMASKFDEMFKRSDYDLDAGDKMLAQWELKNKENAAIAKQLITDRFNSPSSYGADTIRLLNDKGSMGRNVDTTMVMNPDNIRSRFAAFDPWRRNSALAAALGVAAPDLLAEEK